MVDTLAVSCNTAAQLRTVAYQAEALPRPYGRDVLGASKQTHKVYASLAADEAIDQEQYAISKACPSYRNKLPIYFTAVPIGH